MARREPYWVRLFLRDLERTGNARFAAEAAGIECSTAYQRRKRYPDFAERWESSLAAFEDRPGDRSTVPETGCPKAILSPSIGPPGEDTIIRPDGKLIKVSEARWGKRAQESFLLALTETANVRRAAETAGFSTRAVYKRRLKDRHFAAAWDSALEVGKARVQFYLVEAATRTFDPDDLPVGSGEGVAKVSISEAIHIARLKGVGEGPGKKTHDDDSFISDPITREEFEEARQNVHDRLGRLREQMEEQERETGLCNSCGQPLPVASLPAPPSA